VSPGDAAHDAGADADEVPTAPAGEVLGPVGLLAPLALVTGRGVAWMADRVPMELLLLPTLACAVLALVVTTVLLAARRPGAAAGAALLAGLAVVATGVLLRLDTARMGVVPELVAQGGTADIGAVVAVEPRRTALGWQTVLTIRQVDGIATRERAVAFLDDPPLALGDRVELVASARPLPEGGFGRWLAQQHAVAVLDVRDLRVVGAPGRLAASSERVRARIRTAATRHLGTDRGGLLVGFVTGDTRLLSDSDDAAMQATGLSHLTAVSGSNTAVLLAGVAGALTLLRVGAQLRWFLLAATVPWFAFLTRLEPSVLRAGTMALLVIAAAVRGVARDARHLLAIAVLLLVLLDPMLTWSLGLVLSAGATLGVLVIAPRLAQVFARVMPRGVATLLGMTLGAQLAVSPVLLTSFGTIEWVSVPANMVAVPLAALGAGVAFLASAVALVHVGAASGLFLLGAPSAWGVLSVARVGERFTGGVVLPESGVVRAAVVIGICVVAAATRWRMRAPGTRGVVTRS
jgi:competence protein ComEC